MDDAPYRLIDPKWSDPGRVYQTGDPASLPADTAVSLFARLADQPDAFSESNRFLTRTFGPIVEDAFNDFQPISHDEGEPEALASGYAPQAPHVLSTPTMPLSGTNPQNLAGANAGAAQGPRGSSTPNPSGGGAAGGGGGSPIGGNLATLGMEGAFSTPTIDINSSPQSTSNGSQAFGPSSSPHGIQPLNSDPPPVANNDSYTLLHDRSLSTDAYYGVLTNDVDNNGLSLSAALVSGPTHGTLQFNTDGSFVYTPNAHWTGTDSFQYYAEDSLSQSNTATVTLTVNDPGTITTQPSSYNVQQGQVLSADVSTGVLANDSDSDGDSLSANLVSGPSNGTLQFNPDGSFTYTPNAGYVGNDSFSYTATDGVSTSAPTTVSLSVTNTAPTAVDQSYGIPENTTDNVTAAAGLLNGASDSDGDTLTASLVSGASHGSVSVNPDGSFTYTPTTGYTGSDSFVFAVNDGAASTDATASLTVHADSSSPTANAANYSVQHDQTLTVTAAQGVLSYASDSDDDPLSASLVSGSGPSHGTVTVNPDGSFTYVPNAGYTGSDSFQYTAGDGNSNSSPATVTISVTDTGTPTANADSYSVERNNAFSANASTGVLANDSDSDGDSLSAVLASEPSDGQLTFNSDGSFDYTPNSNFTGTDSFTYEATDGVSTSAPATVTLTVSASAPVANDDTYQVLENNTLNAEYNGVLVNDYSPDNMPLTAIQLTQPSHGTVSFLNSGSFTYTPNSNYVGSESFTYEASDGSLDSNAATVTINVKSSDTAPAATNLSYSVDQNTSLSTDSSSGLLSGAADSDGDTLWPVLVSYPSNGTLQFTNYGDGSFTYTPNTNFYGTDSFTYYVTDGISNSSTYTVTLTVNQDVPSVVNASYSVLPTGTTSVTSANGVLANASDPDGASLTASLVTGPAYGNLTFNSDGSFSYTPGSNFSGSDSFTWEAYNGLAYSSPATVTLTTAPVNVAQTYSVNHDTTLSVDATDGLLSGAYDADGDNLTAALATGPSNGTVTVNTDGSFTYVPNAGFTGTDMFTYTVTDGTQSSTTATATINVTDSVPTASPQNLDTPENTALTLNATNGVLSDASDSDGDPLAAQLAGGPSSGMLELSYDGGFTYTPDPNFFGTDSFSYDAFDGVSTSTPATVTIQVNEVLSQANNDFRAVATGDFNGDGNPDFVAANYSTDSVSVFFGNGNGSFQTPVSYAVGREPLAVAVGNFGNGYEDIAVANSQDNTVTILMNNGSGVFTTSQTISVGADPVSIAVGDFRGNGDEDLAVANEGSNTVSILQNNGSGTFSVVTTLNVGTSPDSVAAGDLNGDGKDDLVVANSGDNNISVLLSSGNDSFATPVNYAAGTGPSSVAIADLDGDGRLDVAVANGGSNNVSVLLGNGDGTFQTPMNYAVGTDPVSVAVGDFDGDGQPDLAVVNHSSNNDTILYNTGGGGFLESETDPLGESPDAVAVADFNKDGLADQIVDQAPQKVDGEKRVAYSLGSVAVSSNGNYALSIGTDNKVRVYKLVPNNARETRTFQIYQPPSGYKVSAAAFVPGSASLINVTLSTIDFRLPPAGGGGRAQFFTVMSNRIWNYSSNSVTTPKESLSSIFAGAGLQSENATITSVAYSPDGSKVAYASSAGQILVLSVNTGKVFAVLKKASSDGGAVQVSWPIGTNNNVLVTTNVKDGATFWDLTKLDANKMPAKLYNLKSGPADTVLTAASVVARGKDTPLRTAVVYSRPLGQTIYVIDKNTVVGGENKGRNVSGVTAIALSPNGQGVAYADEKGNVFVGGPVPPLPPDSDKVARIHTGKITSIAYTPDGKYVITSGDDGYIAITPDASLTDGKAAGTIYLK
jgi:WD40 repeat protein